MKKVTVKWRVYWADCDPANILYTGNFFKYFEMAEEELYRAAGCPREVLLDDLGVRFPRVETSTRHFKPARLGDMLEITVWIEKRTEKSLTYRFEMRREGDPELAAQGRLVTVCIGTNFRSTAIPEPVLQQLKDYLPPLSERVPEGSSA